eukprot:9476613-Pyramimonas_sp.AAC.1
MQKRLTELHWAVVLQNAAGFHRRVEEPVLRYPYRLFLLGKSMPSTDCPLRREVAREMLAPGADLLLEVNARKVVYLYKACLEEAAGRGTCSSRLWSLLRLLKRAVLCITQECEGYNSMLKEE